MDKFKFYWERLKSFVRGSWLKAIAIFVVAVIALSIALAALTLVWRIASGTSMGVYNAFGLHAPTSSYYGGRGGGHSYKKVGLAKMAAPESLDIAQSLESVADTGVPVFEEGGIAGERAENFEKSSYRAHFEDGDIDKKCDTFERLKPLDYVVFTYANRNDYNCSYNFWTDKSHEQEIVAKLKALDPREFNISVSSVERSVDSNDFETKLLQEQIDELDETIKEAKSAYSELVTLAKNRNKVSDLTRIIDDKIRLLERLQSKKRSLLTRLARMQRGGNQTLDDTKKVSFSVSVRKIEIVNWRAIKETWREYTKSFVYNLNNSLKLFTYDLVLFAIKVLSFVVYLFVVLVILRFAYLLARRIWKGGSLGKLSKDKSFEQ